MNLEDSIEEKIMSLLDSEISSKLIELGCHEYNYAEGYSGKEVFALRTFRLKGKEFELKLKQKS